MSDKCEHSSTIILFSEGGLSVERCTWACGDLLISRQQPNDVWVTQSVGEIAALQARIAELEKVEVAAKMWRHTWVDDEDVREMESGCQCNICNLVRSVEGVK